MRDYLLEQGVWEQEIDEILANFPEDVSEEDLEIVNIFDTAFDLGNNYIDNVVGTLDRYIEAVLDYSELGRHIADVCDEYLYVEATGRIVEFQM